MTEGMKWMIICTLCLLAFIVTISLAASSSSGTHPGCAQHQGFQRFVNGVNNTPIQMICKDGAVVDL